MDPPGVGLNGRGPRKQRGPLAGLQTWEAGSQRPNGFLQSSSPPWTSSLTSPTLSFVLFLNLGTGVKPGISLVEGLPLHPIKKGMKIHKNQLAALETSYVV